MDFPVRIVQWISLFVQLAAVISALRLIPLTRAKQAWLSISAAIFLVAVRRAVSLLHLDQTDAIVSIFLFELFGLLASVLMFYGVACIAPVFLEFKRAQESLKEADNQLKRKVEERTAELTETNKILKDKIIEIERTETALQESEHRFRSLFEKSLAVTLLIDAENGAIVDASSAACAFYGHAPDVLKGKTIFEINALPMAHVVEEMARARREQCNLFRFKHRLASGEMRDVEVFSNPVPLQGKMFLYSIVHDITERNRMEELVRIQRDLALALGSAANLNEATDSLLHSVLGIEGIDSGGVYLVDNKIGELRLISHKGLSPWFIERVSHYGLDCPQAEFAMRGEPAYWSTPKDILEMGDLFEKEGINALASIPVKCGKQIVAVLNLASHRHDAIPFVTRSALEATASQIGSVVARIRAEELLRESEKRFRELAENIREVFWIRSPDRMLYISPAFEEIWGISRESLYEDPDLFVRSLYPDDREHVLRALLVEQERGSAFNEEYRIVRPDGVIRWIWARSFPVWEDDKLVYHVGIAENITTRKESEEALRESESELRLLSSKLLSAQEEERKRIAHELHDSIGASLGAIRFSLVNTLDAVQEDTAVQESIKDLLSLVEHTVEDAQRIYMNLRPSMLDLLGIIPTLDWYCRQFESLYTAICIEKRIGVEEEQIPEFLKIVIFRIMQESFHNIAKYSRADRVRLSLTEASGSIELAVSDNGVGFDVNSALTLRREKGGLGLTSMRERVQLSGGTFAIESAAGSGTTIHASWRLAMAP